MEGAAGEVESGEGRRHVVVERDDADAEDRCRGPRRRGLRRERHGRRPIDWVRAGWSGAAGRRGVWTVEV